MDPHTISYEYLAPFYDALSYDMPAEPWVAYLLSLAPDADDVLEYGCGTGRITAGLLKADLRVIAVDSSEQMLAQAAENLRPLGMPVRLVSADMTAFALQKPVSCAICACDGVNYILDPADLRAFFSHAYSNLRPGGTFLFDISSPYKLREVLANELFYDDGEEQTLFWQNSFDETTQKVRMDITLFIREGVVYKRFDEVHVQKAWQPSTVARMLEQAGFKEVAVYGFGRLEPPNENDQRIQFCARKGDIE